jgi:hypothetical protein
VEVLVKPWKSYQLYFRDPKTRSFKPIVTSDQEKYAIKFAPKKGTMQPSELVIFKMEPKMFDGYDRMFSRKQDLKYIDLKL